jgi:hypothetical protein
MGLNHVKISGFQRGLDQASSPQGGSADRLLQALNFRLNNAGQSLMGRTGCKSVPLSSDPGTSIRRIHYWPFNDRYYVSGVGKVGYFSGGTNAYTNEYSPVAGSPGAFIEVTAASGAPQLGWYSDLESPRINNGTTGFLAWTPVVNPSAMAVWKNRVCSAKDQRIYFSDIGDAFAWSAGGHFLDIRDTVINSKIRVLLSFKDDLYIFTDHAVWVLYDSINFSVRKLFDVGHAIPIELDPKPVIFHDRFYWTANDGHVYSSGGEDLQLETRWVGPLWVARGVLAPVLTDRDTILFAGDRQVIDGVSTTEVWELSAGITYQDDEGRAAHPWMMHRVPFSVETMATGDTFLPGGVNARSVGKVVRGGNVDPQEVDNYPIYMGASTFTDATHGRIIRFADPATVQDYKGEGDTVMAILSVMQTAYTALGSREESYERLRRVNVLLGGGGVTDTGAGATDIVIDGDFGKKVVSFVDLYAREHGDVVRVRPEMRARYFSVLISTTLQAVSEILEIHGIDMIFRGGKEH